MSALSELLPQKCLSFSGREIVVHRAAERLGNEGNRAQEFPVNIDKVEVQTASASPDAPASTAGDEKGDTHAARPGARAEKCEICKRDSDIPMR